MAAFDYPDQPHQRRHGPRGYREYQSYRPWLRDEFSFRCVYCLNRETWGRRIGGFELDHFQSRRVAPDRETEYDNLVYACSSCNAVKQSLAVPNPEEINFGEALLVHDNGEIEALTPEGEELIRLLRLDNEETTRLRRVILRVLRLAQERDPELYREFMSFPADLPDLTKLCPPGGNARPDGIENSYFQLLRRGDLPAAY